ncbi:hypothetical protein ACFLZZ_03740 [Nanoarchaeota archaeon]
MNEYCIVPIDGKIEMLKDEKGEPILSKNIEHLLETCAIHSPKFPKGMNIQPYLGKASYSVSQITGVKHVAVEKIIDKYR